MHRIRTQLPSPGPMTRLAPVNGRRAATRHVDAGTSAVTCVGALGGALATLGLYKLHRVYRYNFLPRYSSNTLRPYPASSPRELSGAPLGRYYADLTPCIPAEIFDSNGIIVLRRAGKPSNTVFNPCLIAQYAIVQYEHFLVSGSLDRETAFQHHLEWLVDNARPTREGCRVLYYEYDTSEERAPWGSAIAQGMAISALLRGYEHFQRASYLETARELFNAMDTPTSSGGYRFAGRDFELWYEEDNREGHILNGHLLALLGVHDLYRVTGDPYYEACMTAGLRTVKTNIAAFDTGSTTRYRAIDRFPANNAYHYMHAALFEVMYHLTGDESYRRWAKRFYAYHDQTRYRVQAFLSLCHELARTRLQRPDLGAGDQVAAAGTASAPAPSAEDASPSLVAK